MDAHDLSDDIVGRLAAGEAEGDIVMGVCRRTGISWPEAKALVERVRDGRSDEVAKRRLPILVPLAALSMAVGFVLLLAAALPFVADASARRGAALSIDSGLQAMLAHVDASTFELLFLGAGLLAGGTWGLWSAVRDA